MFQIYLELGASDSYYLFGVDSTADKHKIKNDVWRISKMQCRQPKKKLYILYPFRFAKGL